MARSNPLRPFTPDPAQMALEPETSGNHIKMPCDDAPDNATRDRAHPP